MALCHVPFSAGWEPEALQSWEGEVSMKTQLRGQEEATGHLGSHRERWPSLEGSRVECLQGPVP